MLRFSGKLNFADGVCKMPWSHNLALLEKLKSMESRYWYGAKTIENGWSLAVLEHQIAAGLMGRKQGRKLQNYDRLFSKISLPEPQSELALQTMRDPGVFDFLAFSEKMKKPQTKDDLIKNITDFLLKKDSGFAYMGQRYPLTPDFDECPRGILFYNTFLHCYVAAVVVADAASDLKTGQLIPEAAEKMNLCLSLADEKLKTERDTPSIGLILRRDNKNKTAAEYALKDMQKPAGVSEYRFTRELPEEIKRVFPEADEWGEYIALEPAIL